MRYLEKCGKQWRVVQKKPEWEKQRRSKERKGKRGRVMEGKKEEKIKGEENNRSKEASKGVGDLEWKKKSIKVRQKSQETSTRMILQVYLCLWQES